MKSKEKVKGGDNRFRGSARPKSLMVAEGSLQTRAPGYVMPGGLETPFPKGNTGSMQSDSAGRSQRMQARGEQGRVGGSRQGGSGSSAGESVADFTTPRNR